MNANGNLKRKTIERKIELKSKSGNVLTNKSLKLK